MISDKKWSLVSICISSQTIDPAKISSVLNIKASSSHEKGELINRRNPNGPRRQENLWVLESDLDSSEPLEHHMKTMISIIENKIDSFENLIPHCKLELFCGFSSENGQGGFVLDSGLLKRATAIPIDIVFDLYPPEGKQ